MPGAITAEPRDVGKRILFEEGFEAFPAGDQDRERPESRTLVLVVLHGEKAAVQHRQAEPRPAFPIRQGLYPFHERGQPGAVTVEGVVFIAKPVNGHDAIGWRIILEGIQNPRLIEVLPFGGPQGGSRVPAGDAQYFIQFGMERGSPQAQSDRAGR